MPPLYFLFNDNYEEKTMQKTKQQDAIALLTTDHKEVKQLFKEFEKLCQKEDVDEEKSDLVEQICSELTIHAQIEEEIFYPAARDAIDEPDIMDEAEVEHTTAKELIAQLGSMEPGDDLYDAKVTVLGEYINHHVQEEEGEMFPKVKKSKLDLGALGDMLSERKQELKEDMGLDMQDDDMPAAKTARSAKSSSTRGKPSKSMSH
jgi:hemerythrin superfamily protein